MENNKIVVGFLNVEQEAYSNNHVSKQELHCYMSTDG